MVSSNAHFQVGELLFSGQKILSLGFLFDRIYARRSTFVSAFFLHQVAILTPNTDSLKPLIRDTAVWDFENQGVCFVPTAICVVPVNSSFRVA